MMFAPYWWRFWQCINKWYNQKNRMQLVNACKYLSKFLAPIAVLSGCSKLIERDGVYESSYWYYFGGQMITTIFCLYWDFRWDWGLFIGKTPETRFLRDDTKFSNRFYYICMLLNTVFRFWWLIQMVYVINFETEETFVEKAEMVTFVSMMAEAIRRTVWAIIRVENEFFNNFEQYRDIILIPPIKDD
mmetsp:Transcript_3649/g.6217  ORF Transcript_3649/g.6217 Transcript_3649/m.6217 type:complete len:188 (-) Transcript_3649:35-598(-)